MPKKRNFNFRNLEGSSSGKQNASNDGANKVSSVNERLSELRRLEGRDAARKKAELALLSQSQQERSVLPPELRAILGVPESAPPKPKRGVRTRMPNRTPGPAPPVSWVKTPGWSRILALRTGTRRFRKTTKADQERCRPKQLMRFARMTGQDMGLTDQKPSSLQHLALKTAAESWHLFDADDLPMLADLPLRLRLELISYLGVYGPTIDANTLDALTQDHEPVFVLDLAGLIGHAGLTMSRLTKLAKQSMAHLDTEHEHSRVAESWDQDDSLDVALAPNMPTTRFSQLAQLSLSHPPGDISWRDLLSLSKHVPALTHISLAYWPRPTLTPNLRTTTVSSGNSPDVTAGGSHFYSAMDEDLYEPASVLRILSANLLRIKWLDLEGCAEWMPALAFHQDATSIRRQHDLEDDNNWTAVSVVSSIFIKNWTNLTYINSAQGWLPSTLALKSLPRQTMPYTHRQIVSNFEETENILHSLETEMEGLTLVEQRKAETWVHLEDRAFTAERRINAIRRANNVKQVDFDHGWDTDKTVVLRRSV